jgi:hypothetical protein
MRTNLTSLFTDIADAIRDKKSTSAQISPQDFATEISTISGAPSVPTVECWKIDASSLSDEEPDYMKTSCLNEIYNFTSGRDESLCGKSILLSEIDGNIYGGFGPLYIIGSGRAEPTANIYYIAFINVGYSGYFNSSFSESVQYFKEMLNHGVEQNWVEQISLSDFLSLAAQAQNYENANE